MKRLLTERNMVAALFILVLAIFSLAQEQSRAMEKVYTGSWNLDIKRTTSGNSPDPATTSQLVQSPAKSH